jgi:hypothetical protein
LFSRDISALKHDPLLFAIVLQALSDPVLDQLLALLEDAKEVVIGAGQLLHAHAGQLVDGVGLEGGQEVALVGIQGFTVGHEILQSTLDLGTLLGDVGVRRLLFQGLQRALGAFDLDTFRLQLEHDPHEPLDSLLVNHIKLGIVLVFKLGIVLTIGVLHERLVALGKLSVLHDLFGVPVLHFMLLFALLEVWVILVVDLGGVDGGQLDRRDGTKVVKGIHKVRFEGPGGKVGEDEGAGVLRF